MPQNNPIAYHNTPPCAGLQPFVKYFWHLANQTNEDKTVTILPDGYFDILFTSIKGQGFKPAFAGLATRPVEYVVPANALTFATSFKLPAAEYMLNTGSSFLLGKEKPVLPAWNFAPADFYSLAAFARKTEILLLELLAKKADQRKLRLFDTVYAANGCIAVEQISESLHWSSRQINRYFNARFGLSLKAYCGILRYRATFAQLKSGLLLLPEQHYSDQPHFIKEVKKYSGVTPGQLAKNKNDRFIQLSTLQES